MRGVSRLEAAQWLFRFLSPFTEQTSFPPPGAWPEIFPIADRGLVLPRLAIALRACHENVPPEVIEYLEACLELARYRNDRLRDQLLKVCTELNKLNIKPIVIKGAAFLLNDERQRESRMMLDLDLWVPESAQQQLAIGCLQGLGYQMQANYPLPDLQHYPPFFHDDELARIELHHDLVPSDDAGKIDQSADVAGCTDHVCDGIAYRLLDPKTALALSYLQCRDAEKLFVNRGPVIMMKWLDLLDRVKSLGIADVAGLESLGINGPATTDDFQLLTALNRIANLPYSGEQDETFVRLWEDNYRLSNTAYLLRNLFGPMFEWQRWKGKTLAGFGRALINRVKGIPAILRRTRSRM